MIFKLRGMEKDSENLPQTRHADAKAELLLTALIMWIAAVIIVLTLLAFRSVAPEFFSDMSALALLAAFGVGMMVGLSMHRILRSLMGIEKPPPSQEHRFDSTGALALFSFLKVGLPFGLILGANNALHGGMLAGSLFIFLFFGGVVTFANACSVRRGGKRGGESPPSLKDEERGKPWRSLSAMRIVSLSAIRLRPSCCPVS